MDVAMKTPANELVKKKEKINFKFKTKFRNLEYPQWISFYPKGSYFKFSYSPFSYFDPRPELRSNITSIVVLLTLFFSVITFTFTWWHIMLIPFMFFGWGDFYLRFPFDTEKDQCEHPDYGFYMYHVDPVPGKLNFPRHFIWEWDSYKSWDMPWAYDWVRTSILLKDGTWAHEVKGDHKEFYNDEWKNQQYMIKYDYVDKYDNTVIPTKVYVEEREWRQHWLKWTNRFAKVKRTIDVHFSKEVGSRKGSWKGGAIGCGYAMKKGETALQCIQRMEQERTFR